MKKSIISLAVIIAVLCVTMGVSGVKWLAIPLLLCGVLQAVATIRAIRNVKKG